MLISSLLLAVSLLIILVAAEAFTNGLESLGRRYSFSQAVVGNLLSAVGTALPETILPIVAILFVHGKSSKDIGIGAILGAPFMISTLAFFLVGLTVLICAARKRRRFEITIEAESVTRDLAFFIPMYGTAILVPLVTGKTLLIPIAAFLIIGYIVYVCMTMRGKSAGIQHFEGLHLFKLQKRLKLTRLDTPRLVMIILQVLIGLAVMICGAHLFVRNLEHISLRLGMSALLFSLMLAPIATELPEKFNSITWTLKGKDSLAIGNLTGAMMFQATFPVSVGLLFTDWKLTPLALLSAMIALASASLVLIFLLRKKRLSPIVLLLGGAFYLLYVGTLLLTIR